MSKTPNPFHYPGLPPGKYKVVAPYTPFKFDDADYKAMLEGEKQRLFDYYSKGYAQVHDEMILPAPKEKTDMESDGELRKRVAYVAGNTGREGAELSHAAGAALDEIADRYGLKRRKNRDTTQPIKRDGFAPMPLHGRDPW